MTGDHDPDSLESLSTSISQRAAARDHHWSLQCSRSTHRDDPPPYSTAGVALWPPPSAARGLTAANRGSENSNPAD
ncbi:hypothetical protein CRG98_018689 [Punica granatum]|uniref:Uncharacterized protein n=1 Tax=Punica granatum TaxID=22663 RepID=A0A2I0JXD1_PUNGR|nr:hypothetical protein CRG98_018689 [Punica granatum]